LPGLRRGVNHRLFSLLPGLLQAICGRRRGLWSKGGWLNSGIALSGRVRGEFGQDGRGNLSRRWQRVKGWSLRGLRFGAHFRLRNGTRRRDAILLRDYLRGGFNRRNGLRRYWFGMGGSMGQCRFNFQNLFSSLGKAVLIQG